MTYTNHLDGADEAYDENGDPLTYEDMYGA